MDEFQLKSRTFEIHPQYTQEGGAKNFDICLVQTETNEFGVRPDLSTSFDAIPCMPKNFDLQQVKISSSENGDFRDFITWLFLGAWCSLLGCWLGAAKIK